MTRRIHLIGSVTLSFQLGCTFDDTIMTDLMTSGMIQKSHLSYFHLYLHVTYLPFARNLFNLFIKILTYFCHKFITVSWQYASFCQLSQDSQCLLPNSIYITIYYNVIVIFLILSYHQNYHIMILYGIMMVWYGISFIRYQDGMIYGIILTSIIIFFINK